MVTQISGTNANEIVKNVKKSLDNQAKSFPPGLKISIAQDVTDFLYASIYKVLRTLIEAFILVFIVVYIFFQDLR
jgi:HAE1 family hydrophobic/amphiphilic exporter-1